MNKVITVLVISGATQRSSQRLCKVAWNTRCHLQLTFKGFDQLNEKLKLLEHHFFSKTLPHAKIPHGGYGEPPCRLPELLRRKENTYGGIACPVCWGGMRFSQKHQKHSWGVQVFCNLEDPAGERTGGLCGGLAWESTAPGRFRRPAGDILNSWVLFTPKLQVCLVYSFVFLQPRRVKSSMHVICLRLTCFSLEKTNQLFQRARLGADDTTLSLSWTGQMILLNNFHCRGWTVYCAGGQGGVAPLLTAWVYPPSWLTHRPKKVLSQEGTEAFGYNSEDPPPRRASRAKRSLHLHTVVGKVA